MDRCTTCGNQYDKPFTIVWHDGRNFTFDSFECAIHRLAPLCGHCGCRVIGHGMEAEGNYFCCAHCAERAGFPELADRI